MYEDTITHYTKLYKADGIVDSHEQKQLDVIKDLIEKVVANIEEKEEKLGWIDATQNAVNAEVEAVQDMNSTADDIVDHSLVDKKENIRKVQVVITNKESGEGLVRAYPDSTGKSYIVPLYDCYIKGKMKNGIEKEEHFSVIRFGVQRSKAKNIDPTVVGLKDQQIHTLNWVGYMGGSWQVYGDWLIHEGASNPSTQAWGALGCIEVTGSNEWNRFNEVIRELSGETDMGKISDARSLTARYQAVANRPPLKEKQ